MLLLTCAKVLVLGGIMFTLAGAAIGTGILFAGYLLAIARNPEESDNLFNATLMAFALIETFVFLACLCGLVIFFLV
jgi:F0F1-type ATP synthase membrane subunit c/vacuolar-type H+-ATPase subunit K